jgi:hypothetical protein
MVEGTTKVVAFITPNFVYIGVFQLAEKYWAPHVPHDEQPFDPSVVEDIYMQDIRGSKYVLSLRKKVWLC